MCLDYVHARREELPAAAIGYKVVSRRKGSKRCRPQVMRDSASVPLERGYGWGQKEGLWMIEPTDGESIPYPSGVHAWVERRSAEQHFERLTKALNVKWLARPEDLNSRPTLIKVLLRGPICCGLQHGESIYVYKEMTILRVLRKVVTR